MSEWKKTTLNEIVEIEMGQSPSGDNCNNEGYGIPLLNGPTEFGIKSPIAVQYTTDSKRECIPNDILFCVRGSTTGRMNWADKTYSIGRGLAAIRHKYGFEYRYFLRGIIDYNLDLLLSSATGSTFPNVTRSQIESIEINLPPLPEQRAIATILSSLDDKIDLLHRQNATLEKMAETLFRQWFVEEAKEEWEVIKLGKFMKPQKGKNITKEEAVDGEFPVVAGGLEPSCYHNKPNTKAPVITISSSGANAGYVRLYHTPVWSSDSSYIDETITPYVYTFYVFLKMNQNIIFDKQEGSAQPHIYPTHIMDLDILDYPETFLAKFEEEIKYYFQKIKTNQTQIRTLTKLRDNLLPKLMSGEVRVKDV